MRSIEEVQEVVRKLTRWDPAGDDWVKIRQARATDNARRSKLLTRSMIERETANGIEREIYDYPLFELQYVECQSTFVDSSLTITRILPDGSKKTEQLFQEGMSEAAFKKVWDGIKEPKLLAEWQELVWEVNPHWAPPDWRPTHHEGGKELLGAAAEEKNS